MINKIPTKRGTGWTFWRTVVTACGIPFSLWATPPKIVVQPTSLDLAPGDAAGFVVQAEGTPPLKYHWTHDGSAVNGAPGDIYYIPKSSPSDAGSYRVTVSNAEGSVTSETAKLDLAPYDDPVERDFYAPVYFGTLFASAIAPDGTIWAKGTIDSRNTLYHLDVQGAVLPGLRTAPEIASAVSIISVHPLPSGQVLVVMKPDSTTLRIVRIDRSGTIDSSYKVSQLLGEFFGWQRDNPIVVVNHQLVRFTDEGAVDSLFHSLPDDSAQYKYIDSVGRIFGLRGGSVFRLNADGSTDATFTPLGVVGDLLAVTTLSDGSVLLATGIPIPPTGPGPHADYIVYTTRFTIFMADGTGGNVWPLEFITTSFASDRLTLMPLSDGRVLLRGNWIWLNNYSRRGVAIFDRDGSVDPRFALPSYYSLASVDAEDILFPDGGHALINGFVNISYHRAVFGVSKISLNTTRAPLPPRVLRVVSETNTLSAGSDWNFKAYVVGQGPFKIGDSPDGFTLYGFSPPDAVIPNVQSELRDGYHRIVIGESGLADLGLALNVTPAPLHIEEQPASMTATYGDRVEFRIKVRGSTPTAYHWFKDGVPLPVGLTTDTLVIAKATPADQGRYWVVVENNLGQVQSDEATLNLGSVTRLANISVRAEAGTGDKTLIVGYILAGVDGMQVLETAIGPELKQYGLIHPMPDPALEVHTATSLYRSYEQSSAVPPLADEVQGWYKRAGAVPIDYTSKSVQAFDHLSPGAYTMLVDGKDREGGVVLSELFDADIGFCRIINLSARGWVDTGENIVILGFSVRGNTPLEVLIRGVGPGLAEFGVGKVLQDPQIKVVDSTGAIIATNDDWQEQPDPSRFQNKMALVGAFPLAGNSKDASLTLTCNPGNYTVLVTGKEGATGTALVEIYEVR